MWYNYDNIYIIVLFVAITFVRNRTVSRRTRVCLLQTKVERYSDKRHSVFRYTWCVAVDVASRNICAVRRLHELNCVAGYFSFVVFHELYRVAKYLVCNVVRIAEYFVHDCKTIKRRGLKTLSLFFVHGPSLESIALCFDREKVKRNNGNQKCAWLFVHRA